MTYSLDSLREWRRKTTSVSTTFSELMFSVFLLVRSLLSEAVALLTGMLCLVASMACFLVSEIEWHSSG